MMYLIEENNKIQKVMFLPSNHAHYSFSYRWIVVNILKFEYIKLSDKTAIFRNCMTFMYQQFLLYKVDLQKYSTMTTYHDIVFTKRTYFYVRLVKTISIFAVFRSKTLQTYPDPFSMLIEPDNIIRKNFPK